MTDEIKPSRRVLARQQNRATGEAINRQLLRKEAEGRVLEYLDACSGEQLRFLCIYHGLKPWGSVGSRAGRERVLRTIYPREVVCVEVTIEWGKHWNGRWLEPTPGHGCYVEVMQVGTHRSAAHDPRAKYSFAGCPLGRSQANVEDAIADFVRRGREEYRGTLPLTREMVVVVNTLDHRYPEGNPLRNRQPNEQSKDGPVVADPELPYEPVGGSVDVNAPEFQMDTPEGRARIEAYEAADRADPTVR